MCCYDLKERREQTTDIVDAMNKIYRCITPKLPTAKNALFRRDVDGKLKFMEWKWDEPRPERESGYMSGGGGDSGSPLFTYVADTDRKKRHIQIGVYNRAAFLTKRMETKYSTDIKDKCRMIVSKLTGDVVRWLGKIMEFERKCEQDEQSCENRIPSNGN